MMGIIIINPDIGYERLSVELPFNCALNLEGVGFNSHTKPRRSWVKLMTIPKNSQVQARHIPMWSWAWSYP